MLLEFGDAVSKKIMLSGPMLGIILGFLGFSGFLEFDDVLSLVVFSGILLRELGIELDNCNELFKSFVEYDKLFDGE